VAVSRDGGAGPGRATGAGRGLLATFLWLRWRMLVGGLSARRRSGWRLLSAWVEVGGTTFLWLGSLGGGLAFSIAALVAARALATGGTGRAAALIAARALLGMASAGFVLFPAIRGARTGPGGRVRLQLLPIPRRWLHALEVASCLADPWLILIVPALLVLGPALALGLFGPAADGPGGTVALVAGPALCVALVALSAVASLGIELLLRSRRRAEMTALVVSVALIVVSVVPSVINRDEGRGARSVHGRESQSARSLPGSREPSRPAAPGERRPALGDRAPASGPETGSDAVDFERVTTPGPWTMALPSEAYVRALAMATSGRPGQAWTAVAVLLVELLALFGLSGVFWRHLTTGVPSSSGRRGPRRAVRVPEVPRVTPPVAALAWAELKTALRTLPGRIALVSPLVMGLIFVFLSGSDWTAALGGSPLAGGAGGAIDLTGVLLAMAVSALGLVATQSLSVNQLAADGAGLVMTFHAPLRGDQVVRGKVLGLGLLTVLTTVPGSLLVVALRPRALSLWPAVLLVAASAACLAAPVFTALSAVFPKAVDLSRMGRSSQPHQLAGFLALVTTGLAFLPGLGLGAGVYALSRSPLVVLAAEAGWLAVTLTVARFALRLVGRLVDARREAIYLALSGD